MIRLSSAPDSGRPPSPGARRSSAVAPPTSCRPPSTSSAISTTPRGRRPRAPSGGPPAQAVPALLQAVAEHADGYVRYRALVLLTGFNDPRTSDAMRESLRVRTIACARSPTASSSTIPIARMCRELLAALDKEQAEFVRPALVRALAAHGAASTIRALSRRWSAKSERGEDFFRSAVIEALGDYKALYAFDALVDGREARWPAAGRCGAGAREDRRQARARDAGGAAADRAAQSQPSIAAAICLLGVNCELARELPDRDAEVRRSRTPGSRNCSAARRPAWARWRVGGPRSGASTRCSRSASRRAIRRARRRARARRPSRCATRRCMLTVLESARRSRSARSSWWRKASTCSRRISTRSGSSPPSGAPTGQSPEGSPTRGSCARR